MVLILVLVEDGLGVRLSRKYTIYMLIVLILVLVEDGLGERELDSQRISGDKS